MDARIEDQLLYLFKGDRADMEMFLASQESERRAWEQGYAGIQARERQAKREAELEAQRVLDEERAAEEDAEAERERAWEERLAAGMGDGGRRSATPCSPSPLAEAHDQAKFAAEEAFIDACWGPYGPETDDGGLC